MRLHSFHPLLVINAVSSLHYRLAQLDYNNRTRTLSSLRSELLMDSDVRSTAIFQAPSNRSLTEEILFYTTALFLQLNPPEVKAM